MEREGDGYFVIIGDTLAPLQAVDRTTTGALASWSEAGIQGLPHHRWG